MKISASGAGMKATYGNELVNRFKYLAELYSNYEIEVKIYPHGAFGDASENAI
jgi:TRAP-type C4-dicarboxylate transport system substrate-binding protein